MTASNPAKSPVDVLREFLIQRRWFGDDDEQDAAVDALTDVERVIDAAHNQAKYLERCTSTTLLKALARFPKPEETP